MKSLHENLTCRPPAIPVILLGLALSVALVYGRILGHDFLLTWDDRLYVVHNEAVQGFSLDHLRTLFTTFYVGNYAPVQMLSYMLDYRIWGLAAGGFLLTNLLLHLTNGLLFFQLLYRLYRDRLLATVATALFLLHPVQVETVAWVSQRKNLLAMLFFLLAWECYNRYRSAAGSSGRGAYVGSVVFMALAVLSKSVAVIFPAVILAYDVCMPSDRNPKRIVDKIPHLALALAGIGIALLSQTPATDNWGVAAGGGIAGYHGGSPLATLFTMLTVGCRYLVLLLWPTGLSAAYDPEIHRSVDPAVLGAALALGLLAFAAFRLYRADRRLGFWPLYIVIAFAPVAQIVPLITLMNDRYLYFPMLGIAALAGAGVSQLSARNIPVNRALQTLLIAAPLLALAVISFFRAGVWRDDITFGRDTVARCPTSVTAWEGLGEAYYFSGQPLQAEAKQAFQQALALSPTSIITLYNLGVLSVETGDDTRGYELLRQVTALNSRHAAAWSYLGDILLRRQLFDQAEQAYAASLASQPDLRRSLEGMGNLAMVRGDMNLARASYLAIDATGEGNPEVAFRLACIEARADQRDASLQWLEQAHRRGWSDCDRLRRAGEFAALQSDPRFIKLVESTCSGQ
jgi:tetratricopeptide (TPR) repeat protein